MNRTLVRLLIWFFIAALPVQGFAAAVRVCCGQAQSGAMQHRAQMAKLHGSDEPAAAPTAAARCAAMAAQAALAHAAATDSAPAAHASTTTEAISPADAIPAPEPDSPHAYHAASACSACAACFAAPSAMPVALVVTPLLFNSVKVALAPAPLVSGYIPGGLERPPRPTFAV